MIASWKLDDHSPNLGWMSDLLQSIRGQEQGIQQCLSWVDLCGWREHLGPSVSDSWEFKQSERGGGNRREGPSLKSLNLIVFLDWWVQQLVSSCNVGTHSGVLVQIPNVPGKESSSIELWLPCWRPGPSYRCLASAWPNPGCFAPRWEWTSGSSISWFTSQISPASGAGPRTQSQYPNWVIWVLVPDLWPNAFLSAQW